MSSPKQVADRSLDRPRQLFSRRTLMISVLLSCCIAPLFLWFFGTGLESGKAAGAVIGVILVAASVGEFIRRRFRLSLKLRLIAFTALAVLLGLYAEQLVTVAKQRRAVQRIHTIGGSVSYDFRSEDSDWFITQAGITLPSWCRSIFSSDVFGRVERISLPVACRNEDLEVAFFGITEIDHLRLFHCTSVNDDGLQHVVELAQLRSVELNGRQATGAGFDYLSELPSLQRLRLWHGVNDETLAQLPALPNLRELVLVNSGVTDAGMQYLSRLPELESLDLGGTVVGDAGIAHLPKLSQVRVLLLGATAVSDASMVHLKKMKGLRELNLAGTKVTDAVFGHLEELPALRKVGLPPLSQAKLEAFKRKHPSTEVSVYNGRWILVH